MPRPRAPQSDFLFFAGWFGLSVALLVVGWLMFTDQDQSVHVAASSRGFFVGTYGQFGVVVLGAGILCAGGLAVFAVASLVGRFSSTKKAAQPQRKESTGPKQPGEPGSKVCPNCHRRIPTDALRCRHCRAVVKQCPRCGECIPAYASACVHCKAILEKR